MSLFYLIFPKQSQKRTFRGQIYYFTSDAVKSVDNKDIVQSLVPHKFQEGEAHEDTREVAYAAEKDDLIDDYEIVIEEPTKEG